MEIGGDGSYTPDPRFLEDIISTKSKDPCETRFRCLALMSHTWNFRFLRSERSDCNFKFHRMTPIMEWLKDVINPDAIVSGDTTEKKIAINSLRRFNLEEPEKTFFRLWKQYYWGTILQGKEPRKLSLPEPPKVALGRTDSRSLDYLRFVQTWRNPGFRFGNLSSWKVRTDLVRSLDHLKLPWTFRPDWKMRPSVQEEFNSWLKLNGSIYDLEFENILKTISEEAELPPRVKDRLNMFMESDSYILMTLPKLEGQHANLVLTSCDVKLGRTIFYHYLNRGFKTTLLIVHPKWFMIGKLYELEGQTLNGESLIVDDWTVIRDPGAELYWDLTGYNNGVPIESDPFDDELEIHPLHPSGIFSVRLFREPIPEERYYIPPPARKRAGINPYLIPNWRA